ncbi:HD domain-containing protein [Mesorhizobium marinum]|uniref:HD domain-containing protein n=1 Tax=Mesorhizobium marinum TaxID=3228790 RepID=UPI0034656202
MAKQPLMDEALKGELAALYRQPGRHYHGPAHISALLALADEHRAELADPEAVVAAIWFHDAVYDSRRADNEARSAALAAEKLAGRTSPGRLARIVAMIEATATHGPPHSSDDATIRDAALFLDMDLSILGAAPDAFDAYEDAVRLEYGWVDDKAWAEGRAAVLRTFLLRPAIYRTESFRNRYEAQARRNIERSLAALAR